MKHFFLFILFVTSLLFLSCNSTRQNKQIISPLAESNKQYDSGKIVLNDSFSIALIPDTQSYLDFRCQKGFLKKFPINQYEIYFRQMQFIADNSVSNGGIFSFAIHLGDIVDHRGWNLTEWKRGRKGFDIINNRIPFLTVIGNHDYDRWKKNGVPDGTKLYNRFFGPQTELYKNKSWFGGATEDGVNSWSILETNGIKILIIGLEVDPSDSTVKWAQNVINSNSGIPTIIVTHSYLKITKDINDSTNNAYTEAYKYTGIKRNSAEELFSKLIKNNDQIFLTVCGHSSAGDLGEGLRTDYNAFGNQTFAILTDFQSRNESLKKLGYQTKTHYGCGDGWMRILTFDLESKELHVQTYSTEFDEYETDEDSDYVLKLDWDWKKRFPGLYR